MRRRASQDVSGVLLDADKAAAEALGYGTGRTAAEERVEHDFSRPGRGQDDAVQQRLGLLRRVRFLAEAVAQPLGPAA